MNGECELVGVNLVKIWAQPNISMLAARVDISRNTLVEYIKHLFAVGGKDKSFKQIADLNNSYIIIVDDIEYGYGNKIPLWLFGFLY